eukprot:5507178-Pyramimonas_sp.AAC.1
MSGMRGRAPTPASAENAPGASAAFAIESATAEGGSSASHHFRESFQRHDGVTKCYADQKRQA